MGTRTNGPRTNGPPDEWAPGRMGPGRMGPGRMGPGQMGPGINGHQKNGSGLFFFLSGSKPTQILPYNYLSITRSIIHSVQHLNNAFRKNFWKKISKYFF